MKGHRKFSGDMAFMLRHEQGSLSDKGLVGNEREKGTKQMEQYVQRL